jgi:hypothetical protein
MMGAQAMGDVKLPEPLIRLPVHFAAQWTTAFNCAHREPHKNVILEGRAVIALEEAIRAAGERLVLREMELADLIGYPGPDACGLSLDEYAATLKA